MKVILKKGFDFIPKFNGNDKLEKEEQIKLHFQFLTGADFEDLLIEKGKYTTQDEFVKVCTKIDNLTVEEDGVERPAVAEDLIHSGTLFPIYIEAKVAWKKESVVGKGTKKK